MAKKRKKRKTGKSRRISRIIGFAVLSSVVAMSLAGNWFVHHPKSWVDRYCDSWPKFATAPLLWFGNPFADITDSLGWTGHDAVYEYDVSAPVNRVLFAGAPKRICAPAPADITIIDRGSFKIGWSPSLKHPLWCAYHVPAKLKFEDGNRPSFTIDRSVASSPKPADYTRSGYDRGHMVPNHAIISRFGENERRKTFMMSNISPQSPPLNRGVWRDVEHRIADFWTEKYGEIWVVVGCIPSSSDEKISGSGIDIPDAYYQIIIAQQGYEVRALAVAFPQRISWNAWAARYITTIDEIEKMSGLNFNPDLPDFIQDPLEAELPSRLWPIRPQDIFKQIMLRFH